MIKLIKGDCLEEMKKLEDESVDLVLTDPPYGTIKGLKFKDLKAIERGVVSRRNNWDTAVDIEEMMSEFKRVLRPNGRALIFGSTTYTNSLRAYKDSNFIYNYPLYWLKNQYGNPMNAKHSPLRYVEDISVFTKKEGKNEKQKEYIRKVIEFIGEENRDAIAKRLEVKRSIIDGFWYTRKHFKIPSEDVYEKLKEVYSIENMEEYKTYSELLKIKEEEYPDPKFNIPEGKGHVPDIFEVAKDSLAGNAYHPTQKPVKLLEQLIEIYSNEGDVILDAFMGGGSTGVACINTNRKFVGIELDEEYHEVATERINGILKEREASGVGV